MRQNALRKSLTRLILLYKLSVIKKWMKPMLVSKPPAWALLLPIIILVGLRFYKRTLD